MSVLSEERDGVPVPPCGSEAYFEFCRGSGSLVPFCESVSESQEPWAPHVSFPEEGRLLDVLPEANLSADGFWNVKGAGLCLFPTVRPGDFLKVQPAAMKEVNAGEMVVFRKRGKIYCHWAVGKKTVGDRLLLATSSDRSKIESKEFVWESDLIGKVARVARGNKDMNAHPSRSDFLSKLDDAFFILFSGARETSARLLIGLCGRLQSAFFYRKIGRWWLSSRPSKVSYALFYPTSPGIESRFFRSVPPGKFSGDLSRFPKWHLVAHFLGQKAGFLSMIYRPENCPYSGWWISDVYVRIRFRELGLENLLVTEALKLLRRSGGR